MMSQWKMILGWIGIAVTLGLILWIVPVVQATYFPANIPRAEIPALVNENRRTLAQGIAGFVLLLALYFTFRRTAALERTVEVAQQGQITERFTRAIDQLGATNDTGNKQVEVRLGGIYALERIAKDSPERYFITIMEILTAYIRENAPTPARAGTTRVDQNVQTTDRPQADIQAILDVLRRCQEDIEPAVPQLRLDLSDTRLARANLRNAILRHCFLNRANLERAVFHHADLERAELSGASLHLALMHKANLQKAQMDEVDFRKCNFAGANLYEASLHGSDLHGANFGNANLGKAWLRATKAQGARFQGASLVGADLQRADLELANLRQANLTRADLFLVNLRGADLRGAVGVTEAQLEQAESLEGATMPNGQRYEEWVEGRGGRGEEGGERDPRR
jgi:uncharacterized protein YjbI with pentapeptide repeats